MPNLAVEGCDHSLPCPLGIALERFGWSFDGSKVEPVAPSSRLFDHCSIDSGINRLIAAVGCGVAGGGLAEKRVTLGLRRIEPKQRRPRCVILKDYSNLGRWHDSGGLIWTRREARWSATMMFMELS
jgi:hypothetical protein